MVSIESMESMGRSSIQASDELKEALHERKEVGDSYEDVIWRLLGQEGDQEDERSLSGLVTSADLPGGGQDLEERRKALGAVLEHLREAGEAERADLEEIADGFDHGYANSNSLWKNCISPALASIPVVEAAGPSGRWRWVN